MFTLSASLGVKQMGGSVISLYRGNNKTIVLTLVKQDGTDYVVTGYTIIMYVKKNIDDENGDAIITLTGTITGTNTVEFYFLPAHTTSAAAVANLKDDKPYPYDIEVTTDDLVPKTYTCLRSQFVIMGD